MVTKTFELIGAPIVARLLIVQQAMAIGTATFAQLFRFPWRWKEIAQHIVSLGIGSLPIISVSTVFAGIVISHEIAWHMDHALHTISMIPGFTALFILREMGVAIPAMLMISKVGASITAEVGSMKITEQVDALRLLGINPIAYLVFPRWIATIVSLTCLTIISISTTLAFAVLVAVMRYHFGLLEYVNNVRAFVDPLDLIFAFVKSAIFGAVIPIISCAYGFSCKGGAQGVGNATTESVVTSTVVVIILDFVLTFIFTLLR